jgi:hypothetical protein
MERMNGVMNVREAELKEVIKINHEETAYWKNKANNAEEELDPVKRENKRLEEENKKLKETIKDHQLYEEKLEHRIIELEELLH